MKQQKVKVTQWATWVELMGSHKLKMKDIQVSTDLSLPTIRLAIRNQEGSKTTIDAINAFFAKYLVQYKKWIDGQLKILTK